MATHRLPTPGSDNGTWGDILNDFLGQSHSADGTLAPNAVGASQLQDNAVTVTKLAGNIPSTKLDSATQTQLSNVGTIADGSITTAKIASGGIAPSTITGTAVVTADSRLTDQRVPTDSSVTDAKISGSAAIAKTKLATSVQTSLTAADNAVPTTRQVNGHALSSDITLAASDVSAPLKPASGADGKPVKWNNTSGQLEDATTQLNATYAPTGLVAAARPTPSVIRCTTFVTGAASGDTMFGFPAQVRPYEVARRVVRVRNIGANTIRIGYGSQSGSQVNGNYNHPASYPWTVAAGGEFEDDSGNAQALFIGPNTSGQQIFAMVYAEIGVAA